jgi:hypothetical protein
MFVLSGLAKQAVDPAKPLVVGLCQLERQAALSTDDSHYFDDLSFIFVNVCL